MPADIARRRPLNEVTRGFDLSDLSILPGTNRPQLDDAHMGSGRGAVTLLPAPRDLLAYSVPVRIADDGLDRSEVEGGLNDN